MTVKKGEKMIEAGVGFLVGVMVGVVITALCVISSNNDIEKK